MSARMLRRRRFAVPTLSPTDATPASAAPAASAASAAPAAPAASAAPLAEIVSDAVDGCAAAPAGGGGDSSMVSILTAQRDRFRRRISELETRRGRGVFLPGRPWPRRLPG